MRLPLLLVLVVLLEPLSPLPAVGNMAPFVVLVVVLVVLVVLVRFGSPESQKNLCSPRILQRDFGLKNQFRDLSALEAPPLLGFRGGLNQVVQEETPKD